MTARFLVTLASAASLCMTVTVRCQPAAEKTVKVDAILVELAPDQLQAISSPKTSFVGKDPGGTAAEVAPCVLLTRNAWETLRQGIESGKIPGRIICSTTVTTSSGKAATAGVQEMAHYLEKTEEVGLYRLTLFETGFSFMVTPQVTEGRVEMALEVSDVQLQGRTAYPEAPDLAIGPPITSCNSVSTRVILSDDEVVVVFGGAAGQTKPTTFCLVGWTADH